MMMTDHEQNIEHYTYDSWGEHVDNANLPTVANRIRYAGARVECFVDAANQADAIYETGARHYWPAYGRFLQRDPLTYRQMPRPSNPFTANPYIYAENNPVMKTDLTGLAPSGLYQGATMGNRNFTLGTKTPPQNLIYDCCASGFNTIPDDLLDLQSYWHSGKGWVSIGGWRKTEGMEGVPFCNLPFDRAQPNDSCAKITTAYPNMLCTILEKCMGASCTGPSVP